MDLSFHLIGWYGEGACGDDLLADITRQLFDRCGRNVGVDVHWTDTPRDADHILVGGGTLLGIDTMGIYDRLREAKRPFSIFGTGFRREVRDIGSLARDRLAWMVEHAVIAGVRGYISHQFCVHQGIEWVSVLGDPAIHFSPFRRETLNGDMYRVAVSLRSMGKTGEPQYLDNHQMMEIIARILCQIKQEKPCRLYLLDLARNKSDSDIEAFERLIRRLPPDTSCEIVPFCQNATELFSILSQMDDVVSQRLHPTIVGWVIGKPHIALDYQNSKTADFMSSIGMTEFCIRSDDFELSSYVSMKRRLDDQRAIVSAHARQSVEWLKRRQEMAATSIIKTTAYKDQIL